MSQCPNCQQINRPGARFCGYCRAALTRFCPRCGTSNRIQARFCLQCRAGLTQSCPQCGRDNRLNARFCQHCRTALGASASALPQSPVYPAIAPMPPQPIRSPAISVMPSHATGMLPAQTLINNRYLIIRKVGGGGMGAVYKVTDTQRQGQIWAIKEMSLSASATPQDRAEAITSFENEAATLSKLSHVNLPTVQEVFRDQFQRHYMVMEFIDGRTLLEHLHDNKDKALPEDRVLGWAAQLCDVLEYLHNQSPSIIYRDMKPENVMIEQATGRLKLIDFGIVRFHKAGKAKDTVAFGTVGYAPPEQSAAQTDARSDIYAMAATLHHLLTGRDPKGETPWLFPRARQINSALSTKVDTALAKGLETDRSKRPQTMAEFRDLLGCKPGKLQPKPASQSRQQPYPMSASGLVSTRKLDFGAVTRGQQPTRQLRVQGAMALAGSVAASQAWLQVSPDYLSGHNTDIDVTVDTRQLPAERSVWTTPNLAGDFWLHLEPYARRYWWAMLIGLFVPYVNLVVIAPFAILALLALLQGVIWWTFLHASWLVQQPRQYTAQVEIQAGNDSETVEVEIEVLPDPSENRWRWAMAAGLVVAEGALAWWLLSAAL